MTTDTLDFERSLRQLRRRMAWERVCFSIALLGTLGTLGYPRLFPPACTLVVGNRPLVAVADRGTAERVLQAVARRQTPGTGGDGATGRRGDGVTESVVSPRLPVAPVAPSSDVSFAPPVRLARGIRAGVAVVGEEDAARILAGAATVVRPCAAIVVEGRPVAGLATEAEAHAALEQLKASYAAGVPDLEEEPKFKEAVAIRQMPLPLARCYPTPRAAEAALRGGAPPPGSEYRVQPGDAAWKIARRYNLTLTALQRLNPGSPLHPLRSGRTLRVRPAPRPPITVLVKRPVRATQLVPFATEKKPSVQMFVGKHLLLQPGRPGKIVVTTAIVYENGVPAGRQILARQVLVPSRTKVVAVGTRPRG